MRYTTFILAFAALLMMSGCNLEGPEERAIGEMVETFVSGLDKSDDDIA